MKSWFSENWLHVFLGTCVTAIVIVGVVALLAGKTARVDEFGTQGFYPPGGAGEWRTANELHEINRKLDRLLNFLEGRGEK